MPNHDTIQPMQSNPLGLTTRAHVIENFPTWIKNASANSDLKLDDTQSNPLSEFADNMLLLSDSNHFNWAVIGSGPSLESTLDQINPTYELNSICCLQAATLWLYKTGRAPTALITADIHPGQAERIHRIGRVARHLEISGLSILLPTTVHPNVTLACIDNGIQTYFYQPWLTPIEPDPAVEDLWYTAAFVSVANHWIHSQFPVPDYMIQAGCSVNAAILATDLLSNHVLSDTQRIVYLLGCDYGVTAGQPTHCAQLDVSTGAIVTDPCSLASTDTKFREYLIDTYKLWDLLGSTILVEVTSGPTKTMLPWVSPSDKRQRISFAKHKFDQTINAHREALLSDLASMMAPGEKQ